MDHYKVLSEKIEGVPTADLGPWSSIEEIKSNYRRLAQIYHPDKHTNNPLRNLAEEKLKDINIAYQVLGDPDKRRAYDAAHHAGASSRKPRPAADKTNLEYRGMEPGEVVKERIIITNAGAPYSNVRIVKPLDQRIQVTRSAPEAGRASSPLHLEITMRAETYSTILDDVIRVYLDDEELAIPVHLETRPAPGGAPAGKSAGKGRQGGGFSKGMIALIASLGVVLLGTIILIIFLAGLPNPNNRFVPVTSLPPDTVSEAPTKPPAKSTPPKKSPSPSPSPAKPTPTPSPSVPASPSIPFGDTNLENAVREQIGKPQGAILVSDAENVTSLNLHACDIADITPLQYFKSLRKLELGDNSISDIRPLQGLTKLTELSLNNNPVNEPGVLARLQQLKLLKLQNTGMQDISALSGLTNLTYLELSDNQIGDISPLSSLTGLKTLILRNNQIQDVGPLSGLANLKVLFLNGNPITDYTPVQGLELESKDF